MANIKDIPEALRPVFQFLDLNLNGNSDGRFDPFVDATPREVVRVLNTQGTRFIKIPNYQQVASDARARDFLRSIGIICLSS